MADLWRSVFSTALARQRAGRLEVVESGRRNAWGPPGGLTCRVDVHDPSFWAYLRKGSIGLGEAYREGAFTTDDLVNLVRILLRAIAPLSRFADRAARITSPVSTSLRRLRPRTRDQDVRDVRAHYDLGNDFFALFLDETMTYSCAYFSDPSVTLAEAQTAKIDRLCRKLDLRPGQRLVEIGTGWGSLAFHAATNYGVRVTTTTLSDNQFDHVRRRVADAGMGDRVTVLHSDYRDLRGTFDKLVSVEMIEAVDWRDHGAFFGACSRLLAPDGAMALQAIVHREQHYPRAMHSKDYIERYIFPGGMMPSLGAIARAVGGHTDLSITSVEDIGPHYAETLGRWRENFLSHWDGARTLGYDEPFLRGWDFYLGSCRASFLERHISDVQILLTKPAWRSSASAQLSASATASSTEEALPSSRQRLATSGSSAPRTSSR